MNDLVHQYQEKKERLIACRECFNDAEGVEEDKKMLDRYACDMGDG